MEKNRCLILIICKIFALSTVSSWAQPKHTESPSSVSIERLKETKPGELVPPQVLRGTDIRTTFSTSPQNETTIAGNPNNSLIVVGGMNDYSLLTTGFGGNGVVYSTNGGATWTHHTTGVALPLRFTNSGGDPGLAFNSSGRVFYSHIASGTGQSGFQRNNGVFVSSSTDGGITWIPTVPVATNIWPGTGTVPFEDKPLIASDEYPASPFTDNAYVSWTRFYDGDHPANGVPGGGDILFSRSTDDGATWSVPIIVSSPNNEPLNGGTGTLGTSFVQGSEPEVETDGDIYVAYWFGGRINVSRSTDGGLSFGPATQPFGTTFDVASVPSPLPFETFRINVYPNLETDPTRSDHVYVVSADASTGGLGRDLGGDIIFVRSTDNGSTWDNPQILNDDPPDNNQIFPWMAVDANGNIAVIWYDTRLDIDPPDQIKDLDVYATFSTDGGVTWSPNARVTDVSFDPNVGSPFGGTFFGDYNGLGVSPNGSFHALWTDNRIGEQEIFYDSEVVQPIEPDITATPTSFDFTVPVGGTTSDILTIGNVGGADLNWNIVELESKLTTNDGRELPIALQPAQSGARITDAINSVIQRSGILNSPIIIENSSSIDGSGGHVNRIELTSSDQIANTKYSLNPSSTANVAVLGSPGDLTWNTDVQSKLLNTGLFSSVSVINIAAVTPTLGELQAFDAVLVYSDSPGYNDATGFGDNLADYVDSGGGVVCAVFSTASIPFSGRFDTDNYWAIAPSGQISGQAVLGTIHVPGHPILNGVAGFDGGSSSFRQSTMAIASGATRIADWNDGTALIATKTIGGTNRADLGFFPPSSDSRSDFWNTGTNGALIMANSLLFVAGVGTDCPWLSENPSMGTTPPSGNSMVSVNVDASGLASGTYNCDMVIYSNDPDENPVVVPVVLTVNDTNRAPVLTPIADQTMSEGETLDVPVSATDPDGDNISLTVNNLPSFGGFVDNGDGTGTISFAPGFNDAGLYSNIEVIAQDDGSPPKSDLVSFSLTVNDSNRTPVLTGIPNQSMKEGETLNVPVSANDPDGDNISLTVNNLPSFASLTDNGDGTGTIHFTPDFGNMGIYPNIQVIALDDGIPSLSDTTSFTLTVSDSNRAPVLTPIANQNMNEGDTLDVAASATDPDGDNLILSANNLPPFGSFTDNGDGTGTIRFTPGFGDMGVYPNIQVIVMDDGTPALSDTTTFTLTVSDSNRAPVLTPIANQSINEGDTLNVAVSATDLDGDNLTLSTNNLPSFASLTDNGNGTGTIRFTPDFGNMGDYPNIQVIVMDDGTPALSDTASFTLTVSDSNRAPMLTPIANQSINEGDTLNVAVSATDLDGDNLTLSTNNLPPFGNLTDNGDGTGTIRFTPDFGNMGNYPNIQVIVMDDGTPALSDTASFTLTVSDSNRAPVLTPIANQSMNEGDTLNVSVSATDLDGDNLTLSTNNLPLFGNLTDNGDGTGTIRFTPDFGNMGNYPNIQVIVMDDGTPALSDTSSFNLTVGNVNQAPVLTPISNQNMNEGDTMNVSVSSTDPDGDNLALSTNNLPPFGNFTDNGDGTGTIRFTPGFGDMGVYSNIQVIALDDGTPALSDTASFTLTVSDSNRAPILTPIANQNMSEMDTLNVAVSATDLDGDNLTLSTNNLPLFGNLTDNGDGTGTISFTPGFTDMGVYSDIEIIALDDGTPALSDTISFNLTVNDSNRAPIALDDMDTTAEDTAVIIDVLANDSDPDGDVLMITSVTQGSNGSVAHNDSTITYSPDANYNGSDTCYYVISDGRGGTDSATVIITIAPVNDPPMITNLPDSIGFDADTSETLSVWDYVEDLESPDSSLTYTFSANSDSLTLVYDSTSGVLTIIALPGFTGEVMTNIRVSDPEGGLAEDSLLVIVHSVTGINEPITDNIPTEFVLMQNYPNPFNPVTNIRFGLPVEAEVRIEVFNILGQRVATLLDARKPAGYYTVQFNIEEFSNGLYFYRIHAGDFVQVRKMVLMK